MLNYLNRAHPVSAEISYVPVKFTLHQAVRLTKRTLSNGWLRTRFSIFNKLVCAEDCWIGLTAMGCCLVFDPWGRDGSAFAIALTAWLLAL